MRFQVKLLSNLTLQIACGFTVSTWVQASDGITAYELKKQAMQNSQANQRHGVNPNDLKSMLSMVKGKDATIIYEYRGEVYPGIQLPDGSIAPAIVGKSRRKKPGCLANNLKIYPAKWDQDHLICQLPKNENSIVAVDVGVTVVRTEPVLSLRQQADAKAKATLEQQGSNLKLSKYGSRYEDIENQRNKKNEIEKRNDKNKTDDKSRLNRDRDQSGANTDKNRVARSQVQSDPNVYIPPARSTASDQSTSLNLTPEKSKFGISFGTWAEAKVQRSITNADAGEVEIILTQTLMGKFRTLESNTILYGVKSFNVGTNRLDVKITRGITPEDEEIKLSATVFNERKEFSGLSGVLIRNRNEEAKNIAKNTLLQTAGVALQQISPGGLTGKAYDAATSQALQNEKRHLKQQNGAIIKVFPQSIYIRFDSSI